MSFPGISEEHEVVRQIRRDIGVDEELVQELARGNPGVLNAVQNLKDKLARSLQILSDELYSKPAHFVLETIQNADDNAYAAGVVPELHIVLRESYMEIQCNEAGFSAANVKAFCGIGQSTKKNRTGYIGEKGIGAKAMFKVANRVHVHSLGYHFVLDRHAELGMISPQWTPDVLNQPGWTLMRLDFCDANQFPAVKSQLHHVRKNVLLFMRRLARLTIDDGQHWSVSRSVDGDICTITTVSAGVQSAQPFLRVANVIPAHRGEPKREHVETTEIVLAFPLDEQYKPVVAYQMVHAFLPMRSVGFNFLIQADFLTAANREDVLNELQWNKTIRDGICDTFCSAVAHFRTIPNLEMRWLRFLPAKSDIIDSFFSYLATGILAKLQQSEVVKCRDGQYRIPSSVRFPSVYSLHNEPLIPEDKLSFHYVSEAYPGSLKAKLKLLGVQDMQFGEFMGGLSRLGHAITLRDQEWMEATCSLVTSHGITLVTRRGMSAQYQISDNRIRDLPIAQLADGSWTNCTKPGSLFFSTDSSHFPHGLGINVLSTASLGANRRQLLSRLGIESVSVNVVVGKILAVHRTSMSLTVARVLEHVLYVYRERTRWAHTTRVSSDSLWLASSSGQLLRGSQLYMDEQGSGDSELLSSLLEPPAKFLHPDFLSPPSLPTESEQKDWRRWLRIRLHVSIVPRVANGRPSPEFTALITRLQTADTPHFLTLLRRFWPGLKSQLSPSDRHMDRFRNYVSSLLVRSSNGRDVPLKSAFIPNHRIAPFATDDMPMLPISDPEEDWGFLGTFGVSSQVNAAFFLKRLSALSEIPGARRQDVEPLYKQLEARFHEIPDEIRNTFQNHPVFLVDNQWRGRNDVVWEGPSIMTLKIALKTRYHALEGLFRQHLSIPDAQPGIIADELKAFAEQHSENPLSDEQKDRLSSLLSYAAQTIPWIRGNTCPDWTPLVGQTAMFPVSQKVAGNTTTKICTTDAEFFLPDPSGRLERLFAPHAWILAIPPQRLVDLQPLIDHFGLHAKRIDRRVRSTVCIDDTPVDADADFGVHADRETDAYQAKLPFLRRVQHYKGSGQVLISSIAIYQVQDVKVTYTLEGTAVQPISVTSACWSRSDADGNLELFVASSASARSRRVDVVREISRALGLSDEGNITVSAVIRFTDEDEINDMLINAGIREFEEPQPSPPQDPVPDEEDDIEMDEEVVDPAQSGSQIEEDELIDDEEAPDPRLQGEPPARHGTASTGNDAGYVGADDDAASQAHWTPALSDDELGNRRGLQLRPPARRRRRSRRSAVPAAGRASATPAAADGARPTPPPTAAVDEDIDAYVETDAGRTEIQQVKNAAAQARLPQVAASTAPPAGEDNQPSDQDQPAGGHGSRSGRRSGGGGGGGGGAGGGAAREGLSGIALPRRAGGAARTPATQGRAPDRAQPPNDARMKQIGFLGERYVFELLSAKLKDCAPAFTYENWTSPFRALAGHPPFEGQELADFVYHDKAGLLTKRLFPRDSEYYTAAPEYFIEVKATSGEQSETFHVKRRQILQAMQLSKAARKPEDKLQLYVLFRVSGIGGDGAPVLKAYVDPHDMLARGTLRIETDSVEMSVRDAE